MHIFGERARLQDVSALRFSSGEIEREREKSN